MKELVFGKNQSGFNTDDGIRRAAMARLAAKGYDVRSFNTDDGIRRAAMGTKNIVNINLTGFNTDDGIRRAAITGLKKEDAQSAEFQYR